MATVAADMATPLPPLSLRSGIATKLQRAALFPALTLTARTGIARSLHRHRTEWAARKIEAAGLSHLRQKADVAGEPQDPADLWHVYETIRTLRPERVLEMGSGQTTKFIAQALRDNGTGHLFSLDANARWLDNTRAMLPVHLRRFVTLVHSPVILDRSYGEPAWRYSLMPEGGWDFILVDGPEGTAEATASCDLIDLAPRMRRGAVGFIDHRVRTALLAREVLGASLRIRYVPSLESFVFSPRKH